MALLVLGFMVVTATTGPAKKRPRLKRNPMGEMLKRAILFLRKLERHELSALLLYSECEVEVVEDDWFGSTTVVRIRSPEPYNEALNGESPVDKQRILEAVRSQSPAYRDAQSIEFEPNAEALEPERQVLAELVCQRNLMIDVATGGARINDVDDYFRARNHRLAAVLKAQQIDYPVNFESLWDWYQTWKDVGGYKDRRRYVRDLFTPAIDRLAGSEDLPVPLREPTGWNRVDRTLQKARVRLEHASSEEDFQSVGLLCREVLISLGQAVYDPLLHRPADGPQPSDTDVKRVLEAFLRTEVPGPSNETLRKQATASVSLALDLQHRRTAGFRLASLCLEATSSTVNVIAILAGGRDLGSLDNQEAKGA